MLRAALDPDDAAAFDQHFFDGETFANLRTGFGCCIDEQLVEYRPPRAYAAGVSLVPGTPAIVKGPKSKE
jgi:hypothetical protein